MFSWRGSRPQHTVARISFCPSKRGVDEMPIHWESAFSMTFVRPVVSSPEFFICSWDKALSKSVPGVLMTSLSDISGWWLKALDMNDFANEKYEDWFTNFLFQRRQTERQPGLLNNFAKQLWMVCITNINNYSDRNLG